MNTIKKLSEWMKAQIGTRENPPGSNSIKYNDIYYGGHVSGDAYPWCCGFQWVGFKECDLEQVFLGGLKTAYCPTVQNWAIAHGAWITSGYREGDLLLFDIGSGIADHIGYCLSFNGTVAISVEGNWGDKVARVSRNVGEILGAYRPAYPDIIEPSAPVKPADPVETEPLDPPEPEDPSNGVAAGDAVAIAGGARWWTGTLVPTWATKKTWIVKSISGRRAVLNRSTDGQKQIMSPINTKFLKVVKTAAEISVEMAAETEYKVQSGDTLWSIAQRYLGSGLKYKLLMEANGLTSENIYPGQIIKIP